MKAARYADDDGPIDATCGCEVCARHTRGYLRHLFQVGEPTALRLVSLHNIAWTLQLMSRMREAIAAGTFDTLRRAVIAKDNLFFNRWRPHNETYLFGFRKHEQGQNAKEIPMYDPLIARGDETIQKLKAEALAQSRQP